MDSMFLVLALVLVAPFVEIAVMVKVAEAIGTLNMVGLLLVISVAGVFIVKHQGTTAWLRIRADLERGAVPGASLVDGGLVMAAGALLIVPGFVSDAFGLLLLLPPVRALVRTGLRRRFQVRVATSHHVGGSRDGSIDVDSTAHDRSRWDPPELDR
jgi:UPF0716 protein FxsA